MVHKISSVSGIMNNNIMVFWNVIMCHLVDTNILEETAASTCRRECEQNCRKQYITYGMTGTRVILHYDPMALKRSLVNGKNKYKRNKGGDFSISSAVISQFTSFTPSFKVAPKVKTSKTKITLKLECNCSIMKSCR